jgi:hypothetical protein
VLPGVAVEVLSRVAGRGFLRRVEETRDEAHQAKSKLQLQASLPHILIMATLSRSAHDEEYTKVAPPPPHPLKGRAIIVTGEHSHLTCWA